MPDDRPLFQAMFSDRGARRSRRLWAGLWPKQAAGDNGLLDLFTDGPRSGWRGMFEG